MTDLTKILHTVAPEAIASASELNAGDVIYYCEPDDNYLGGFVVMDTAGSMLKLQAFRPEGQLLAVNRELVPVLDILGAHFLVDAHYVLPRHMLHMPASRRISLGADEVRSLQEALDRVRKPDSFRTGGESWLYWSTGTHMRTGYPTPVPYTGEAGEDTRIIMPDGSLVNPYRFEGGRAHTVCGEHWFAWLIGQGVRVSPYMRLEELIEAMQPVVRRLYELGYAAGCDVRHRLIGDRDNEPGSLLLETEGGNVSLHVDNASLELPPPSVRFCAHRKGMRGSRIWDPVTRSEIRIRASTPRELADATRGHAKTLGSDAELRGFLEEAARGIFGLDEFTCTPWWHCGEMKAGPMGTRSMVFQSELSGLTAYALVTWSA